MSRDAFIALARDAIVEHVSAAQTGGPELDRFLARLQFVAIDAEGEDGWAELARVMAAYAGRVQCTEEQVVDGADLGADAIDREAPGRRYA